MAEQVYDRLLEEHPDYWLGWFNRGIINLNKGNYDKAIADLTTRLKKKAEDPDALAARAQAFLGKKLLKQAEADLEQARNLPSANAGSIDRKLQSVRNAVQEQERIRHSADQALRRNPNDEKALRDKASSSFQLGDNDAAIRAAESLRRVVPDDPEAWGILIQAYDQKGLPGKAAEIIRDAENRRIISPDSALRLNRILQSRSDR